eukprot:UN06340
MRPIRNVHPVMTIHLDINNLFQRGTTFRALPISDVSGLGIQGLRLPICQRIWINTNGNKGEDTRVLDHHAKVSRIIVRNIPILIKALKILNNKQ